MKGVLVLITVLVFASMTEAFSGRWAKNREKGFRHRNAFHHPQGTFYTNIQIRIKNIFQLGLSTMMMMVGSGCGDTCDQEAQVGYDTCISQWPDSDPDPEEFLACWSSYFDSDCHDCLCDYIYDNLGIACPSA